VISDFDDRTTRVMRSGFVRLRPKRRVYNMAATSLCVIFYDAIVRMYGTLIEA